MKHPLAIEGFNGSIEEGVMAVAKMRYDGISLFIKALANEFRLQAEGDKKGGRLQLAALLLTLASALDYAVIITDKIWALCKKFMPQADS